MKSKISKQSVKCAKYRLGSVFLGGIIAGSLFLGCSSDTFSSNEFKPSNEMEKKAYKLLKEKYPNVKFVSYDSVKKEMGISKESKICKGDVYPPSQFAFKVIEEPNKDTYFVNFYYKPESDEIEIATKAGNEAKYWFIKVRCSKEENGECSVEGFRDFLLEKFVGKSVKFGCEK